MSQENIHLQKARAYLAALERFETVEGLFHEDVVQIEHPNRFNPTGQSRRGVAMQGDLERAKRVISAQTYEVRSAIAVGDKVAMQVVWRGVLAAAVGSLKVGDEMICHTGIFLDFRDGQIVHQENYDCFPPF